VRTTSVLTARVVLGLMGPPITLPSRTINQDLSSPKAFAWFFVTPYQILTQSPIHNAQSPPEVLVPFHPIRPRAPETPALRMGSPWSKTPRVQKLLGSKSPFPLPKTQITIIKLGIPLFSSIGLLLVQRLRDKYLLYNAKNI
jgi:hypothetical protein